MKNKQQQCFLYPLSIPREQKKNKGLPFYELVHSGQACLKITPCVKITLLKARVQMGVGFLNYSAKVCSIGYKLLIKPHALKEDLEDICPV